MRHTRNRQLFKLTGHKHWKETYNIPMWESRKWARELDQTFKWHRNYEGYRNFVEFSKPIYRGDERLYKTTLLEGR